MNKNDCVGNRNLSETVARLLNILPYCSRPVTIAFVYARCWSVIPTERRDPMPALSRKFAFRERVSR
jgi:hypothetical protein